MRKPAGKVVLALLLVALYVLPAAMAASTALHQCVHHDAANADHQCAATVIAHGQLEVSAVAVAAVVPTVAIPPAFSAERHPLTPPDFWLLPERAPPVSLT